jgi:hypothetical protein
MRRNLRNLPTWLAMVSLLAALVGAPAAGSGESPAVYFGEPAPGSVPAIFRAGAVSSDGIEIALAVHPGGNEMYLTRIVSGRVTLLVSTRAADSWTAPELAPFSSSCDDAGAFVTGDGEALYFTSKRPGVGDTGPRNIYHIWTVTRRDGAWQEPAEVAFPLESAIGEASPSLTLDGTLYYSAEYPSLGGYGVYRSRIEDGARQLPELALVLSNAGGIVDVEPFVASDASYILFYSAGRPDNLAPSGMLGDLYASFRTSDGAWTEPRNLGTTVNTAMEESSPTVTADGQFLFFGSNRAARNHLPDIYWVGTDFLTALKPAQP